MNIPIELANNGITHSAKEHSATTKKFARWLTRQRTSRKMTFAALADLAGCSVATIYDIEHCTSSPSLDTVEKICKALDASVDMAVCTRSKHKAKAKPCPTT